VFLFLCVCIKRTAESLTSLSQQLVSAITCRKRCFLEKPEWKTIPFASDSLPRRTIGSFMQDILSDIPGYIEDMLTLQNLKSSDQGISFDRLAKSLRYRATVSIEKLCALRWQWEDEYPDACYEVVARRGSTLCINDDTGEPLYPTILSFRSVARALEITTFNTMFLILYRVLSVAEADEVSVRTDREAVPPYPNTGTRSSAYGPIRPLSLTPTLSSYQVNGTLISIWCTKYSELSITA